MYTTGIVIILFVCFPNNCNNDGQRLERDGIQKNVRNYRSHITEASVWFEVDMYSIPQCLPQKQTEAIKHLANS